MSNLLIREARPDDAPVLLAAEKETARTPGLLVSRPHELTLQAFEQKIAELAQRGRYIVRRGRWPNRRSCFVGSDAA